MTESQMIGAFLVALLPLSAAALSLPAFMRWGVETRGYRFLCFTERGAERLAAHARSEGSRATVVRVR